jgi:hypothetical protein
LPRSLFDLFLGPVFHPVPLPFHSLEACSNGSRPSRKSTPAWPVRQEDSAVWAGSSVVYRRDAELLSLKPTKVSCFADQFDNFST